MAHLVPFIGPLRYARDESTSRPTISLTDTLIKYRRSVNKDELLSSRDEHRVVNRIEVGEVYGLERASPGIPHLPVDGNTRAHSLRLRFQAYALPFHGL